MVAKVAGHRGKSDPCANGKTTLSHTNTRIKKKKKTGSAT